MRRSCRSCFRNCRKKKGIFHGLDRVQRKNRSRSRQSLPQDVRLKTGMRRVNSNTVELALTIANTSSFRSSFPRSAWKRDFLDAPRPLDG